MERVKKIDRSFFSLRTISLKNNIDMKDSMRDFLVSDFLSREILS